MFDLVIRSDRVVTPAGVAACDVAIQGEKIAAVAATGTFGADSTRRLIDATGQDRHARRHRSARALQVVFAAARRHASSTPTRPRS